MSITENFSALVVLLVVPIGCAIIPKVNNPCVDLIFCTLKGENNYCEFYRSSGFVITVDRTTWNIAQELTNRSTIIEYGDYECATIRNLQVSDTGDYALHISKEDGLRHLRQTFSLTESVLKNLLNASNFNVSKSRIDERLLVPVYWRRTENELPAALRLTAGNGTTKDFSLALVVTAQDPAKEKPMDVTTPTGTTPPPRNNNEKIIIAFSVLGVICVGVIGVIAVITYYFTRTDNSMI